MGESIERNAHYDNSGYGWCGDSSVSLFISVQLCVCVRKLYILKRNKMWWNITVFAYYLFFHLSVLLFERRMTQMVWG